MITSIRLALIFFVAILPYNCQASQPKPVFIRVNQLGYLPSDLKSGVVFSENKFESKEFVVRDIVNNKDVFRGKISNDVSKWGKFKFCYSIDFTKLKSQGTYQVEIAGAKSPTFKIANSVYTNVVDSLLLFYKVQRCGPTDPYLHGVCHLSDVQGLEGGDNISTIVDVTGGWHDAGDYLKFLSTTAYATYMMIFAYEFDKAKFGFDDDNNGVPDILDEAKIGLDWLLRANYSKYKLVTQVQNLKDHDVGWRMPETDTLRYQRPGYVGIGKNQVGLYTAVMALGAKVWLEKFGSKEFSRHCLNAAENIYSLRNKVPDVDNTHSGFYQDSRFWGKLALGAIEMYNTTKNPMYLKEATTYGDSAGSDYWWSWGDINSLADFRIAKYVPRFSDYILNNLQAFNANKDKSVFREGMAYSWGTTNSFLGIALQVILYKTLTGKKDFDSLATYQRDYILGRNPWGISFIYNIGSTFPKHLHSQIAYFHDGYLPGALSAGPSPESVLKNYDIKRENFQYDIFNSDDVKYYDDRWDYVTNEPTIVGNATALFVFGYLGER